MSVKISAMDPATDAQVRSALVEVTVPGTPNLTRRATALQLAMSGVISVTSYGAIGDGAADDTAAIQAALDAAESLVADAQGKPARVYLPSGEYLSDPLYVTVGGVQVFGDGSSTVLRRKPGEATSSISEGVINFHGASVGSRIFHNGLFNMLVDGNSANVTPTTADPLDVECVSCVYTAAMRIEGVVAINGTSEGFDFDYSVDGTVIGCYAADCGGAGFHFSLSCARMLGQSCIATNCGHTHSRGGFDTHSTAASCSYVNCNARACYRGFVSDGQEHQLASCTARDCTANGFRIVGDRNQLSACCAATDSANGITIVGDRNTLSACVCVSNGAHGITAVDGAVNNVITGAVCNNNGADGIRLASGANNNIVIGCQLGGNALSSLGDLATGTIAANNKT